MDHMSDDFDDFDDFDEGALVSLALERLFPSSDDVGGDHELYFESIHGNDEGISDVDEGFSDNNDDASSDLGHESELNSELGAETDRDVSLDFEEVYFGAELDSEGDQVEESVQGSSIITGSEPGDLLSEAEALGEPEEEEELEEGEEGEDEEEEDEDEDEEGIVDDAEFDDLESSEDEEGLPLSPFGRLIDETLALGQRFHRFQSEVNDLTESVRELRQLHQESHWGRSSLGSAGGRGESLRIGLNVESRASTPHHLRDSHRHQTESSSHHSTREQRGLTFNRTTITTVCQPKAGEGQILPRVAFLRLAVPACSVTDSHILLQIRSSPPDLTVYYHAYHPLLTTLAVTFAFSSHSGLTLPSISPNHIHPFPPMNMDDELHEIVIQRRRDPNQAAARRTAADGSTSASSGPSETVRQAPAASDRAQPAVIDLTFSSDDENMNHESLRIRPIGSVLDQDSAPPMAPPPNRNRRRQPSMRRTPPSPERRQLSGCLSGD